MRKTGVTITIFAIVTIALMIGGSLLLRTLFIYNLSSGAGDIGGVYKLSSQDMFELEFSGMLSEYNSANLLDKEELTAYASGRFSEAWPYVILPLCGIIIFIMYLLWRILIRNERARTKQLIDGLDSISDGTTGYDGDEALRAAYKRVENLVERNVSDYKRLQFYLSHEQKNNIAILRADPDISGSTDKLQILGHISDSIDDILTLSDSASDTPLETVDVALVCASACDAYRGIAGAMGIAFDFDEDASHNILATERWIYRAVCNLLDNAVKYGLGNPVTLSVNSKNNSVVVCVRDRGIGIEEDELDKIFSHHYRIRELNSDGYGIGLSLVSHVCDRCGGFPYVESEKGHGSAFYLSFPQN
jgi:two-component sensor histidine kinase